jgi:hypothetical protein
MCALNTSGQARLAEGLVRHVARGESVSPMGIRNAACLRRRRRRDTQPNCSHAVRRARPQLIAKRTSNAYSQTEGRRAEDVLREAKSAPGILAALTAAFVKLGSSAASRRAGAQLPSPLPLPLLPPLRGVEAPAGTPPRAPRD